MYKATQDLDVPIHAQYARGMCETETPRWAAISVTNGLILGVWTSRMIIMAPSWSKAHSHSSVQDAHWQNYHIRHPPNVASVTQTPRQQQSVTTWTANQEMPVPRFPVPWFPVPWLPVPWLPVHVTSGPVTSGPRDFLSTWLPVAWLPVHVTSGHVTSGPCDFLSTWLPVQSLWATKSLQGGVVDSFIMNRGCRCNNCLLSHSFNAHMNTQFTTRHTLPTPSLALFIVGLLRRQLIMFRAWSTRRRYKRKNVEDDVKSYISRHVKCAYLSFPV